MLGNKKFFVRLKTLLIINCAFTIALMGSNSLIPYISSLPSVTDIYMVAEEGGKNIAAIEAYKKIQNPFFVIAAHNGTAIATIFFSQGVNADAIIQLASDRLARYGALTLYGFGSGASAALLNNGVANRSFDLYIKPITLGTVGIIGMSIVCSSIPLPFIASSAHTVFQGMTINSGIKLATNMLQQGVNTKPIKEALATLRKPETALFNNAVIIAGTLGIMAVSPLLLTYASAALTSSIATQITATMALSAALDITEELSEAAIYTHAATTGSQISSQLIKPLPEQIRTGWQRMSNFFSSFMGEAGSFFDSIYGGSSMLELYGGE